MGLYNSRWYCWTVTLINYLDTEGGGGAKILDHYGDVREMFPA